MTTHTQRTLAVKDLLTRAVKALDLQFGFLLWDGTEIAPARGASPLRVSIADVGALASLLRSPSLDTFIRLHVDGRIDWVNGTIFDLAALRPAGKVGKALRAIGVWPQLKAAFQLITAPGSPAFERGRGDDKALKSVDAATNKKNIAHHYDVSYAFF
jgi:cyclopropane-fatty-acyl-phospholipid synthase